MTDRELLEMAAKAAGYQIEWVRNSGCHYRCEDDMSREQWCPLDDDGDALRLAVKLYMCVQPGCYDDYDRSYAAVYLFNDCGLETVSVREPYTDGLLSLSATRRAIVRAAAAIGSAM